MDSCERKIEWSATKPNEKWVTDITYIQYGSVTLYLSTIMDLYNNEETQLIF